MEQKSFPWPSDFDDIHSVVERRLRDLVGEVAGKLHTGRSRNDQVALDLRLFTIDALSALDDSVADLARALIERAKDEVEAVMPGYTHLQRAQVVSLAHHLLAHVEALRRDRSRIAGARVRAATSPPGAGPRAGAPHLREQRVPLSDATSLADALAVLALVVRGLRFDREAMRRATERGMLAATDLADHLAKRGVPFREAHEIVGRIVRERLTAGKDLGGVTIEELRGYDGRFEPSAVDEIRPERSLASRAPPGGTAPDRVREALAEATEALRK